MMMYLVRKLRCSDNGWKFIIYWVAWHQKQIVKKYTCTTHKRIEEHCILYAAVIVKYTPPSLVSINFTRSSDKMFATFIGRFSIKMLSIQRVLQDKIRELLFFLYLLCMYSGCSVLLLSFMFVVFTSLSVICLLQFVSFDINVFTKFSKNRRVYQESYTLLFNLSSKFTQCTSICICIMDIVNLHNIIVLRSEII